MTESEFTVECPCGVVLRASTEADIVQSVQEHASQVHEMELDADQVLGMARPS